MVPDLGRALENVGINRNYESLGGATPSDFGLEKIVREKSDNPTKSLLEICLGTNEKRISYFKLKGLIQEKVAVNYGDSSHQAELMIDKFLTT